MNSLTHQLQLQKTNGIVPPFAPSENNETNLLTLSYCPKLRLLNALWNRSSSSDGIRQSIRVLSRTAAILRAELMLIEIPGELCFSEDDQRWAGEFIRQAMQKTPLRRIARVVDPAHHEASLKAWNNWNKLNQPPYDVELFSDSKEATRWLLEENNTEELTDEDMIIIPQNISLKLIRSRMNKAGAANVSVASAQSGQSTALPAPVQEVLTIKTDFVSMVLDHGKNFMSIRWLKSPHSRQYRYGMLKAGRALIEHQLERLILNNQRLGILTLEDQGWLISMSQQLLPKTKLQKLAVVTSADAMQQMSSENIGKKLQQAALPHQARYFLTEEEAYEWLMQD